MEDESISEDITQMFSQIEEDDYYKFSYEIDKNSVSYKYHAALTKFRDENKIAT